MYVHNHLSIVPSATTSTNPTNIAIVCIIVVVIVVLIISFPSITKQAVYIRHVANIFYQMCETLFSLSFVFETTMMTTIATTSEFSAENQDDGERSMLWF